MAESTPCIPGTAPYPVPGEGGGCPAFLGRERESRDLVDLISANSEVLLYAGPGSGKSSLLQAGVLPRLGELGFQAFPPIRVTVPMAAGAAETGDTYLQNALAALAGEGERGTTAAGDFCTFLGSAIDVEALGTILIVDQIEEILDAGPENEGQRQAFFLQLADCLKQHRQLRLVFSLSEERLAAMERYFRLLPERMTTRMHLEELGHAQVLQVLAHSGDCAAGKIPLFNPAAAELLYEKLSSGVGAGGVQAGTRLQGSGSTVNPLLLQLAWALMADTLPPGQKQILPQDVETRLDPQRVAMDFYDHALKQVLTAHPKAEQEVLLRQWFEQNLTDRPGRMGAERRDGEVAGLPLPVADELVRRCLLTCRRFRGRVWYELPHTSMAPAIRLANERWFEAHDPLRQLKRKLERQAQHWLDSGRDRRFLLAHQDLIAAEHFLGSVYGEGLDDAAPIRLLVRASRHRRERMKKRQRLLLGAGFLLMLVGWVTAFFWNSIAEINHARNLASRSMMDIEVRPYQGLADALDAVRALEGMSPLVGGLPVIEKYREDADEVARQALDAAVIQSRLLAKLRFDVPGEPGDIWGVAIGGPEGELIATAHGDGRIRLWDGRTYRPLGVLAFADACQGAACRAVAVAFDAGAARLAGLRGDGRVGLWRVSANGAPLGTAPVWQNPVFEGLGFDLAFSADGGQLVVAGAVMAQNEGPQGRIHFLSAVDGSALASWNSKVESLPLGGLVFGIALDPSGTRLAIASNDNRVKVVNLETGRVEILSGHHGWVYSVAFSGDGRLLATGSADRTARVWQRQADGESWKQLTPPLPHRDILGGLIAFDPGGRWLATVSADSLARLWDVQTGKLLRIFSGHTGPLYGVAFSAKGQRLVTGGGDGVARVWSLFDTNELLAHTDQVQDIGFGQGAACGDLLVAVSADATLSLWDIGSGEMIKRIATDGEGLTRVSMSNDCTWIAAAGAAGGLFLTRVDSDSGWQPIESGIGRINAIQLLSDGDDQALRLFVGGAEGVIKAWAISKEDGKATPLWTSTQLRGAVNDLAIFSPSPQGGERHLLAAITNADNTFWEAGIETTGKRVKFEAVKNCGLRRISRSIAVTRGGDLVASLGNQVVVLRVEGDILSCELLEKRISGFLLDLAAGPDGKQFAVTSTSGTVSIGTLSTSDWKRSFAGYRSPVNAVSYAGNGRVLATGSADGKIRLHLLDKQALIRRAEEEQGRVEENLQKK